MRNEHQVSRRTSVRLEGMREGKAEAFSAAELAVFRAVIHMRRLVVRGDRAKKQVVRSLVRARLLRIDIEEATGDEIASLTRTGHRAAKCLQ